MAAPYTKSTKKDDTFKEPEAKKVKLAKDTLNGTTQCTLTTEPDNTREAVDKRPKVRFVKLTRNAMSPTKGSYHSAGHDLYSAYDCIIAPGDKGIIPTDIAIELPRGCYGRIAPRSGLAIHHSLHTLGGVVDRDFRGTITVILINFGNRVYYVKKGDRVAQLILEKIHYPHFIQVGSLANTDRGDRGFGSTGK